MSLQIISPYIHVEDANGIPYVGARLYIYQPGTTTLAAVFTDDDFSTPADNPAISNAKGDFPRIFIAAGTYKLRAEQKPPAGMPSGTLIFEEDNVDTGLSAGTGALPVARGGTGAMTAAAARVNLDVPSNSELAALAANIASLSGALQNIVSVPQGYLTPTSGVPVIASDVVAGTAIYYTPFIGNIIPIFDEIQFNAKVFTELTLTLNSNHVSSSIYDCFVFDDDGELRLVTGPAWTTITAGSGARGSGAGTTELVRTNGLWTNKFAMTARNGATTYPVAAQCGTYVGTINIDASAGQVTCHRSWGSSRKWSIWNSYNRQAAIVAAGDATASWTYSSGTVRASRNDSTNSVTVLCGLSEELVETRFHQNCSLSANSGNAMAAQIGIGVNSTTTLTGVNGRADLSTDTGTQSARHSLIASTQIAPFIGLCVITSLERSANGGPTFFGGEDDMRLTASWRA